MYGDKEVIYYDIAMVSEDEYKIGVILQVMYCKPI